MDNQGEIYTIEDVRNAVDEGAVWQLMKILQNSDIDLNVTNAEGDTPLTYIIGLAEDFDSLESATATIKLLLKYGADPNMANSLTGIPPLYMIDSKGLLFHILMEYGADPSYVNLEGRHPLTQAFFNHDYDSAILFMEAGANKEIVYNHDMIHGGLEKQNIDRFFETCEEYKKIIGPSNIKGIPRKK